MHTHTHTLTMASETPRVRERENKEQAVFIEQHTLESSTKESLTNDDVIHFWMESNARQPKKKKTAK